MEEFALEFGEKVTKRVRKHPFLLIVQFIGFFLLAIFPLALPLIVSFTGQGASAATDSLARFVTLESPWMRFALGIWWLSLWMAAAVSFTRWFLTIWVITNTRIVDIHQVGFFNRKVTSAPLARVQDVTTDVNGFFNTVLGFGTLKVQTAGAEEELIMEDIIGPQHLRDFIMKEIAALHSKGTV